MRDFKIKSKYIFWALCCFLIFALPSIIYHPTAKGLREYAYLVGGVGLCYTTYNAVQSPRYSCYVKAVLYLLIIFSAIAAIKGIYQYEVLHIDRPKGAFINPNVFATHMEIIIPVVIAIILSKKSLYTKVALSIVLFLLFGGLIVTLSRGAIVSLTFVILLMLLIEKNYKALLLTCIPAGIAIVSRYDIVLSRIYSIFDLQMRSNIERLNVFNSSIAIIKINPLVGVGLENFRRVYKKFMVPGAKDVVPHAHNIVLAYATEAGILTAIAFIVFVLLSGIYLFQHFPKISDKNHRLLVLGISCGVLSLLIHGLVDYTLRRGSIIFVFMFLVGIGLGLINYYAESAERDNRI